MLVIPLVATCLKEESLNFLAGLIRLPSNEYESSLDLRPSNAMMNVTAETKRVVLLVILGLSFRMVSALKLYREIDDAALLHVSL
jgi:hypothetical protein